MLERLLIVQRNVSLIAGATVAATVAVAVAVMPTTAAPKPVPPPMRCDAVPALGVCMAPSRFGVTIARVDPGSIGWREGWRVGDWIAEVDCRDIWSTPQLRAALLAPAPHVKIVRGGVTISYRKLRLASD